jgi:histidinol phosphatase-like PHP family hydrolase
VADRDRPLSPVEALRRIAFLLERSRQPTYRVRAFRGAAATVDALVPDDLRALARQGRLRELSGVGEVTERVILEALAGEQPGYLRRLEAEAGGPLVEGGGEIRMALRGDCHTHSDWSDGGSPIREMAETARELGHEYIVLTDHSQRLTVARGLDAERLRRQLAVVAELNDELAPFRILTGMEVDILEDGSLDMSDELLGRLDLVVASVHSKLRMERVSMTRRMVTALASPHTDVLGHCTGRIVSGRGRPESEFSGEVVFTACRELDKAVEINSRPERLDPPRRLLRLAVETGCRFSIDSDAHAPGQLDWLPYGCARAEECGVPLGSIVNTMSADDLLGWTASHAPAG